MNEFTRRRAKQLIQSELLNAEITQKLAGGLQKLSEEYDEVTIMHILLGMSIGYFSQKTPHRVRELIENQVLMQDELSRAIFAGSPPDVLAKIVTDHPTLHDSREICKEIRDELFGDD